jgi:hypothetical protein
MEKMRQHNKGIEFYLFLILLFSASCYCQNSDDMIISSIETKLDHKLRYEYHVFGINIDKAMSDSSATEGKIKDPYHTLAGCYIFLASGERDANLYKPKGFIGIYKCNTDSILWCSIPLTTDFSGGVMGLVSETNEINNDGKVEIIITQAKEPRGEIEQLWIFSWDGKEGKLITELDKFGESTIICETGYSLFDVDNDGIFEIQGTWTDENGKISERTFSWNGFLYGNWGKTSKYFHKGKHK